MSDLCTCSFTLLNSGMWTTTKQKWSHLQNILPYRGFGILMGAHRAEFDVLSPSAMFLGVILDMGDSTRRRFSLVWGWSLSTWTFVLEKTSGWWWTLQILLTSCSGWFIFSRPVRTRARRWVEQQKQKMTEDVGSVWSLCKADQTLCFINEAQAHVPLLPCASFFI